jgi:hypothetical protein
LRIPSRAPVRLLGQMGMLATLGALNGIAEELVRHGTWRSIERIFYGFGEAETLLARHPAKEHPLAALSGLNDDSSAAVN